MTGRAAGYCAGYSMPGFANPMGGRGFGGGGGGFGRGGGGRGGWGRRNGFYATGLPGWQRFGVGGPAYGGAMPYGGTVPNGGPVATKQQELDMLKGQVEYFEDALNGIKKRITELEAESAK